MSRASQSPPRPLEDMSREQLLEIAREKESQLNVEKARADAAEKRRALEDTTNGQHRGRPRKRGHHGHVVQSDDDDTAEFEGSEGDAEDPAEVARMAGHKFGLTKGLWFTAGVERTLKMKLDTTYDERKRFDNHKNKLQGDLRDALDVLPEQYKEHAHRKKAYIVDKFNYALNRQRQHTTRRIRNDIGPVFTTHIDEVKDVIDLLDATTRGGWTALIGGKADTHGNMDYSVYDAPVLHSDKATSLNPQTFLYAKVLMHVAAGFLYGPTRAIFLATKKNTASANSCMVDIHHLDHTTPGIIANAVVITMYSLSADTALRQKGPQTGINWHQVHQTVLEYLLKGLRDRRQCIVELFRAWDDELFPETESSMGQARGIAGAIGDERRKGLEALDAMSVVQDEGDSDPVGGDDVNSDDT
ncbi:hypothetical protein GGX14DRAFT_569116 [Mycena pura]|uniref:Uncharacterized protein n=1 Tax=Mycena pura TaxID=153505 RepID=A0AAD6VBF1_9AGAR|nr:hypothetical protein GGX14DRAFT_569116 [Mycena pura]